jgi:hypothetical protein
MSCAAWSSPRRCQPDAACFLPQIQSNSRRTGVTIIMASLAKPASAYQPRAARLTTIFLTARLTTGSRDDLCRVRDISTGGMRLETLAPVDIGQPIDIELKNGLIVRGEIVWVQQPEAGVRFAKPAELAQLLALPEKPRGTTNVRVVRAPRLKAQCPVALRHKGRILSANLTDISQGGARLRLAESVNAADYVVLLVPGLDPRPAVVCWTTDEAVGVAFVDRLGFGDLARWLASPERFAPELAAASTPKPQSSGSATPRPVPSRPPVRKR